MTALGRLRKNGRSEDAAAVCDAFGEGPTALRGDRGGQTGSRWHRVHFGAVPDRSENGTAWLDGTGADG